MNKNIVNHLQIVKKYANGDGSTSKFIIKNDKKITPPAIKNTASDLETLLLSASNFVLIVN